MKLLVKPNLWLIIHGNRVEKANDENLHKIPAGIGEEGDLYVYRRSPKPFRYKITKIYDKK